MSISFEDSLRGKVVFYVQYVNEVIQGKGRRVGVYLRDKPAFASRTNSKGQPLDEEEQRDGPSALV
jgi:hypothetical protein